MPFGTFSPNSRNIYFGNVASKCLNIMRTLRVTIMTQRNLQKFDDCRVSFIISYLDASSGWNPFTALEVPSSPESSSSGSQALISLTVVVMIHASIFVKMPNRTMMVQYRAQWGTIHQTHQPCVQRGILLQVQVIKRL